MFKMLRRLALWLISFYQKVLSVASFGSCRYYPTCSEYAKWQLMYNGFFKGLWASLLRILRCNQLFLGGIDYPVVSRHFKSYSKIKPFTCKGVVKIVVWYVPKSKNQYYLIRSFAIIANIKEGIFCDR
jgi:putative membrane protein insertion efficiency factor